MMNLQNQSPKILVIGDLMIDQYLWGTCDRVSPEAPVQVVNVNKESTLLGGAGNVVNNLKTLGAKVDIMSVLGDCENSNAIKQLFLDIDVETKYLFSQKNRLASKKSRIIASQQQVVRYDRESTDEINSKSQELLVNTFKKIISEYECILLSDYGKGLLTHKLTQTLISIASAHNKKVLIDPKGFDYSKYKGAYLLTPNIKEASEATKTNIHNDKTLTQAITKLKLDCDLHISLITLSEKGVAIFDDNFRILPTSAREVFDVTGAGDTVLASLGFALSCGLEIDNAVMFSNLAAGVVVGKIGSSTATLNEIIEYESSLNKPSSEEHIKTLTEISLIANELRKKSKKIIFTNGCFDLLHSGHVKYLETAKTFGDVLILGLNSDKSVRTLKGGNRPINTEKDRGYILAALEAVNYVVIFDEDTPYNLIKAISPNILVKGSDYAGKKVIGEDLVDELVLVKYIDGKSSTQTIHKILKENKS
jgi:D-beta-D-heptose 7-phosphate kinase/D-beta-D-heptose 1-phosphate adenosyltransferase